MTSPEEHWIPAVKTHMEICEVSGPEAFIEVKSAYTSRITTYKVDRVTVATSWSVAMPDETYMTEVLLDLRYKLHAAGEDKKVSVKLSELRDLHSFESPDWLKSIETRALPRL